MKIALAVFAFAAICSAQDLPPQTIANSPAPDYSTFTRSYTLPYTGAVDFCSLIHVHASINGGPVGSFDVDTGSVGIVVSADDVPNIDPNGEKGSITYSSSGIELDGIWTLATVHFPDAIADDGKPAPLDVKVKVLAVTKRLCHDMGPNSGKCTPSDHATGAAASGNGSLLASAWMTKPPKSRAAARHAPGSGSTSTGLTPVCAAA